MLRLQTLLEFGTRLKTLIGPGLAWVLRPAAASKMSALVPFILLVLRGYLLPVANFAERDSSAAVKLHQGTPGTFTSVPWEISCSGEGTWPVEPFQGSFSKLNADVNSYWDCYGSFDEQRLFSVKFALFRFCSDLGNPGIRQIVRDSMLTGRWWEWRILINLCGKNNVRNWDLFFNLRVFIKE